MNLAEAAPRRTFMKLGEVAPLLLGVALGRPVALRRVLGARRGGRYGIALACVALLLAAGSTRVFLGAAGLHVALGLGLSALRIDELNAAERLRLSLWTVTPCLMLAALAGLVGAGFALPSVLAVVAGQLWLLAVSRNGLPRG